MSDADAVYRQIVLDPWCDTSRLAYADLAEEGGRADLAGFVRVQVELARTPKPPLPEFRERGGDYDPALADAPRPYYLLRARERELFGASSESLTSSLGPVWVDWPGGAGKHCRAPCHGDGDFRYDFLFRRGFLDRVRMPADAWTDENARFLFSRHPVTGVEVAGKDPSQPSEEWIDDLGDFAWYAPGFAPRYGGPSGGEPDDLPHADWVRRMDSARLGDGTAAYRTFPTREVALDALSRVVVDWGRGLAGLPPLSWS